MAASPLPSEGSNRGRKCYATPAFSEVPNSKHEEQNLNWFPTKKSKISIGCLTSAFSRV